MRTWELFRVLNCAFCIRRSCSTPPNLPGIRGGAMRPGGRGTSDAGRGWLVCWRCLGRQAEALDAFHRLRRVLDEDLGVVPGAELCLLHQAILQHSSELAWHPRRRDAAGRAGYFGRGPEMSRLLACLEKAAAGRGGVVLLAGEPGIGKSHALRRLIDRAGSVT